MKNKFEFLLETLAEEKGEKDFLINGADGRTMNYGEFLNETKSISQKLTQLGVRPGDRVLLMADNSPEFAVDFFGVTFCHGVTVPVNTHQKWRELEYLIEDTQAAGILVQEKYRSNLQIKGDPKEVKIQEDIFYIPLRKDGALDLPEETAMLLYTSGTTGHPKGVILSFDNLLAKAADIIEAHELTDKDRVLCVLPWFHINGLVITLITSLVSEQTIIIAGKFSVSRFWEYVEKYKPTWFSGVPTMYSHMLSRGIPEQGKHSSLRFARSASSALPVAVLEEFESTCHVPVIESYGITEGSAQITSNPLPPRAHKPGSVGIAFGNKVRVVNGKGEDQPANTPGEVWIKGDNITCGYYHKEDVTEKSFTEGWFHSGDLGYLDEEGYLFLCGRIKELINRAGEKFPPGEIDEVLYQMPQVELAAAVGVPDPIYGEEAAAFIKVKEGSSLTGEEVQSWCRQRIASYKVPGKVYFVDDLPQGGNGKIQRLKLLDVYKEMEGKK